MGAHVPARRFAIAAVIVGWMACAPGAGILLAGQAEPYVGRPVGQVRVALNGVPKADTALLAVIDTRAGQPLRMADVRETILRLMALGRFDAVEVRARAAGPAVDLVYDCVPRRVVSGITFRGTPGLPESTLRAAVTDRYGTSPSPGRAEEIAGTLEAFYHERGYTKATITPVVAPGQPMSWTSLVFDVQAGPRARYGRITLDGEMGLPPQRLFERLAVKPADPYDRPALLRRISSYLGGLRADGYYEARLEPAPRVSADGQTVDLTLSGQRGPHITVEFRGSPLPKGKLAEFVPVKREGSVDQDLLEDSGRSIVRYLQLQGYRDGKASHRREQAGGELMIVFDVQRGPVYRIRSVEGPTGTSVPMPRPSDYGLQPGALFVQGRRDVFADAALEQCRRQGFESARIVEPSVLPEPQASASADVPVDIRIAVAEGPRTLVGGVTFGFEGEHVLGPEAWGELVGSKVGGPYYAPQVAADADAITRKYLNLGFPNPHVRAAPSFNSDRSIVDIRFRITEGPQLVVDRILIAGNVRTSTTTIQREIVLKTGDPIGIEALAESQRRLSALGLFRRVQVAPLQRGMGNRRDVLVSVEEAPATTIGYGGGLEAGRRLIGETGPNGEAVESLDFAPRGSFEIGRRNLWGKNRSISLFTRISLRRGDVQQDPVTGETTGGDYGFNEYRAIVAYREPRAFGTTLDMVLTAFIEQGVRSSFDFNRRAARAELVHRLSRRLSISGRYSLEETRLFNQRIAPEDQLEIDRLFPQVRISAFSSSVVRDTRDDQFNPTSGTLLSVDGKLAVRAIGSEVGFIKTYTQAFWFYRFPGSGRVVFGTGARLGLATGFPSPNPDGTSTGHELPASERFFAGGDSTVRGFALDRLGAPNTLDPSGVPNGGNASLILNAEIRTPLRRGLDGVAFLDVGNVFATVPELSLTGLRSAAGFGVRYRSPIGPIRFDFGFKLSRHRFADGTRESPYQWYIAVGQAF